MIKALKIFAWTLFALVMTVIIVVCSAIYVIFTPERLTPIARQVADQYVNCQYEIGEVDLTFFSTFPRFGLRADGLLLINPTTGAQNDTVVEAKQLIATVDVQEFIERKNLHVHEAILKDASVHFFIAEDGTTNLSGAFVTSPDTTEEDTTAFSLPFDQLYVDGLHINAKTIDFIDKKDAVEASLGATELSAKADSWNDMLVTFDAQDVCAALHGETYANNLHLELIAPMAVNLDSMHFAFDGARLAVNDFQVRIEGEVTLSDNIDMDVHLQTGTWDIKSLMALVPKQFTEGLKDVDVDGNIQLKADVKGTYSDNSMPLVTARLILEDGKGAYKPLPYALRDVQLDAQAVLNLNKGQKSDATINHLGAKTKHSSIGASGKVKDLLGDMLLDVQLALDANLPDFADFLPDSMILDGRMKGTAKTKLHLSDLQKGYIPRAEATLASDHLFFSMDTIEADLKEVQLEASLEGGKKVSAKLKTSALNAHMGEELKAKTGNLALEAAARYNKDGENALLKWNPRLKIDLKSGELNMPEWLPEPLVIPSIEFKYSNREMTIDNSRIELGNSDLELKGHVRHIGKWFRHQAVLEGELDIVSNYCDANQLLAWFSADEGSEEETKPSNSSEKSEVSEKSESDPFLVPTDVDLALKTHMREVAIFNQNAKDLKGGIYVKNGTLILDEVGFVCRAAKLQLTGMYRTPRRNHLYAGFDYHMIDVDIDELLSMIPNLEQMVPMLSSFKGAAQFHLAVETYLNAKYEPKMSTLRGAASLTGKDLVVLDGETFSTISKLLLFSKKTENKIDSLNAEITLYKNQIDVYPLCVQMDNYMVALGGRHRTDMTFDYDINVLKPIYIGVHVGGSMNNLEIKLAKCKFAQDFRPHWYQKADNQSRELRERIKQSMEKNVRIQ